MKITKGKLKQMIREAMDDMQGEFDPSANMPTQSFGGDMTGKNYRMNSGLLLILKTEQQKRSTSYLLTPW
jgi:hypothetical protein